MRITRDQMAHHITGGHAQPWTHTLHGQIPTAARLHDTWYVVLDGDDAYQPAPEPLATTLTQAHDALTAADQHLTGSQR